MNEAVYVQWFPGHMTKTKRLIEKSLPMIDGVVEILDARIPFSSHNPDLSKLINNKPKIVLLNKADVANPDSNKSWISYFEKQNIPALPVDCKTGKGLNIFTSTVKKLLLPKIQHYIDKGMTGRTIRLMVVGIPNVGKSSFINRMSKSNKAKVADRPGVTRGNQWFNIGNGIELMDTAGVLWPKFDDPIVGEHLAFTGAVKDTVTDIEFLAVRLLNILCEKYPNNLTERYKISVPQSNDGYEVLNLIGKKRGMLISGGVIDTERASVMVLDEFRAGKLGKISLEVPDDKL